MVQVEDRTCLSVRVSLVVMFHLFSVYFGAILGIGESKSSAKSQTTRCK